MTIPNPNDPANTFNYTPIQNDGQKFYEKKLARSSTDAWLGGVAGGVAETYGWNPALVRLAFVATILIPLPGSQILLYLLAWFIMPKRSDLR